MEDNITLMNKLQVEDTKELLGIIFKFQIVNEVQDKRYNVVGRVDI